MESPRLVVPSSSYKDSYRSLVAEFLARGERLIPFPLSFPNENFEAFLAQLAGCEQGIGIPEGFVPHSTFWLLRGEEVVGVSNVRHRLNDRLRVEGGHIGYGIRPTARGQGLGNAILRLTLAQAARLGIDHVLLTCSKDNVASSAVIAGNGGRLESEAFVEARGEVVQRWLIDIAARAEPAIGDRP
ncbi:MAG TPA: GNAT family N-acetyltransferase [Usitatibacteraceae bacterium]|nr:GNAT family N-acetyltransferase [Usitatibacteraceae bacterium]